MLVAEFHTNGGPLTFTAQVHTEYVDARYRIAQDRANEIVILTGAGGEFIPGIDFSTAEDATFTDLPHFAGGIVPGDGIFTTFGGKADAVGSDLEAPQGPSALAAKVPTLAGDRFDVLVANVGISMAARIEDYTVADFDNLFATNVRAPFFLLQQLLPLFGTGSSVVVITSLAARVSPGAPGQVGAPSIPAYAATKGALETL